MEAKDKPETTSEILSCSKGSRPDFFKFAVKAIGVLGKNDSQKTITVKNPCFEYTTLTFNRYDVSTMSVEISANSPSSLLCSDLLLFGTALNYHVENIFMKGRHIVTFKNLTAKQIENIENYGIHIFQFCDHLRNLLPDLLMTAALFVGGVGLNPKIPFFGSKPTFYQEMLNPLFIKHAIGYQWERRANNVVIDLDESMLHSGDYMAITRMDGVD